MDPIAYNTAVEATESSLISESVNNNIDIFGSKENERCNPSLKFNGGTCITMERSSISYNKPENYDTLVSPNENSDFNKKCVSVSHQRVSRITNTPVSFPMEHLATELSPDNCDKSVIRILSNPNNYQDETQVMNETNESDEDFTCSFVDQLNPLAEQIQYDLCRQCQNPVTKIEESLTWGSMTFCNDICLGMYEVLFVCSSCVVNI